MTPSDPTKNLPQSELRPERRISWFWIIPILALLLAGWLGYAAWAQRGIIVRVQLDEGYGLRAGDDVRYRGIVVGQVRSVELADELAGVIVTAALQEQGPRLARGGARFWVVRPQVGLTGIAGLDTLVGPRYLAVLPGDGPRQRRFVGLGEPPMLETREPGDLEIILNAQQRFGMQPGRPVLYRQVPVGRILSVGLTSDGGAVEARVHIHKAYTTLIRPETRFWNVGGFDAQVGLKGVSFHVDSIESLLAGGVALATPPDAGDIVRTGHRFEVQAAPEDNWLDWEPVVFIGNNYLPPGSIMPSPMRAAIAWKSGRWFTSQRSRDGWVLQTESGLLGPADLFRPDDAAQESSIALEVAGQEIKLPAQPAWTDGRLALLDASVADTAWPDSLRRTPETPENCIAVGDPAAAPLPLSASRLTAGAHVWQIDRSVSIDSSWHGACVLAQSDGKLVGMIVLADDGAVVALLDRP